MRSDDVDEVLRILEMLDHLQRDDRIELPVRIPRKTTAKLECGSTIFSCRSVPVTPVGIDTGIQHPFNEKTVEAAEIEYTPIRFVPNYIIQGLAMIPEMWRFPDIVLFVFGAVFIGVMQDLPGFGHKPNMIAVGASELRIIGIIDLVG